MPRGDKSAYTDKQKRKAEHIGEGYKDRGVPEKDAERRAWATVNKESGGGYKTGSGRGHAESHASSKKAVGSAAKSLQNGRLLSVRPQPRRQRPVASETSSMRATDPFI